MTIADEKIELSLVEKVTVPDNTDGKYYGPRTPEHQDTASLTIELDGETSAATGQYEQWIWFMFYTDEEPWFRLTPAEAEAAYERLGVVLGKTSPRDAG